jgi:hypothetical protein
MIRDPRYPVSADAPFGRATDDELREIGRHLGVAYDANGVAIMEPPTHGISDAERKALATAMRELAEHLAREAERTALAEKRRHGLRLVTRP